MQKRKVTLIFQRTKGHTLNETMGNCDAVNLLSKSSITTQKDDYSFNHHWQYEYSKQHHHHSWCVICEHYNLHYLCIFTRSESASLLPLNANPLNYSPDNVRLEKSFSKNRLLEEAWKNSQKSAVVGGGEGESGRAKEEGAGEGRQLEEAGLRLELGVLTS